MLTLTLLVLLITHARSSSSILGLRRVYVVIQSVRCGVMATASQTRDRVFSDNSTASRFVYRNDYGQVIHTHVPLPQ